MRTEVRVRTTLVIDDAVATRARLRAVEQGITLSEFVTRALERALDPAIEEDRAPVSFPRFGGSEVVGHTPEELAALLDEQEARR